MVFGVVVSSEGESRFFAVAAASEDAAIELVRSTVDGSYLIHHEDLEGLLHAQYGRLSELITV